MKLTKLEKMLNKNVKHIKTKGSVIVISAPSGAGKTTVIKYLLKHLPNLVYSVSCTTREKRPGEINGKDYTFLDEETFIKMINQKKFVEWAKVHQHYYGTPKKFLETTVNKGKDVLLDIDVQGGKNIRKFYPNGIYIFLLPPSFKTLKQRLVKRGQDSLEEINVRLRNAVRELQFIKYYDYIVINNKLSETLKIIESIIIAEKHKTKSGFFI